MYDDDLMGSLKEVGFQFAPVGYMHADGSLLRIADHTALFALFGTFYGGDGRETFGLPDKRPIEDGKRRAWRDGETRVIVCVKGIFPARD